MSCLKTFTDKISNLINLMTDINIQAEITHVVPREQKEAEVDNPLGGKFNLNIVNDHELHDVLRLRNFMEFFGLGDYDSYYTLDLDQTTSRPLHKFLATSTNTKHQAIIVSGGPNRIRAIYPRHVNGNDPFGDDEKEETNVQYTIADNCFKIEVDGNEIICIIIPDKNQGMRSILMCKTNLECLKEFANNVREEHQRIENEKRVIRKQIMVYTNYRKGMVDGAAGMMAMEHSYMYESPHMMVSDWKPTEAIRARSFESVFLNKETKNALLGDIEDFMSDETREWYDFHDIPSKRSYLFYGPPGTGKTSTVKAIAGKYNMGLYIMKLNLREMDDMAATNLMQQLPPRSILLIEDIDANFDNHGDKTDMMQSMSFSGLMNILDGVSSFNQQLVIMTTNKRDMVNRESLRTGRIDMEIEFGYMDVDQATDMIRSFYEREEEKNIRELGQYVAKYGKVTPVELQEVIIRSKNHDFSYIRDNFDSLMESVRAGRGNLRSGMFN